MVNTPSKIQAPASRVDIWTAAARPKTLGAAVAPVLVGTAMAWAAGGFHAGAALCALLGALLIQIGTNFSNDYTDYLKGADTEARKGPLRVTQAGLVLPETMKRATIGVFVLAFVVGLYLVWRGGWPVLAIGLLSIFSGVLYTVGRYSLAYLGLADLFVLVFFGPVAVGGTYYVQALEVDAVVLIAGLAPGLLSTAILLVNNIRDVEEDREAGKKTLVVRLGKPFGIGLYVFCVTAAALIPLGLFLATGRHPWAIAVLPVVLMAVPVIRKLRTERNSIALNPLLGATGRLLLVYSVLFSIGWIV